MLSHDLKPMAAKDHGDYSHKGRTNKTQKDQQSGIAARQEHLIFVSTPITSMGIIFWLASFLPPRIFFEPTTDAAA